MEGFSNPHCMRQLMQSVQRLAQPADVQLHLFPVFVCKADELALDFANFWSCAKGSDGKRLTAEQTSMLDAIDAEFDDMTGSANAELWTDDALRHNPRWEHVRELAKTALVAFGWPYEVPPNENTYIRARGHD